MDLATLDTLPHGLSGNAQQAHCLIHGEISAGSFFRDAFAQIIGETNLPRSARRELFAADNALVEPAMNRRRCNAELRCCLLDVQQFAFRRVDCRFETRDAPLSAQTADEVGREALTVSALAALTIEDACNHRVGVMSSQPPQQCGRVLVGAHTCWKIARRVEVDVSECAAAPTQRQMRATFVLVNSDDDLLKQCAQFSCRVLKSLMPARP